MRTAIILITFCLVSAGAYVGAGAVFGEPAPTGESEQQADVRAVLEDNVEAANRKVSQFQPGPAASNPLVASGGQGRPQTMDGFLTDVIGNVDGFWVAAFARAGLPEPRVTYNWLAPGQTTTTQCTDANGSNEVNDSSAFYCSLDDTIFVSQQFASDLWNGLMDDQLAGAQAGQGHAVGDFGVAYVIAHEYAHNIQTELGYYDRLGGTLAVKAFELQADCFAGAWAHSAYTQGLLEAGDIEEAVSTAQAVGDFDFADAGHHGTPDERLQAFQLGYGNGNAADCDTYLNPETVAAGAGDVIVIGG
jgi:predicted metalloprotease